MIMMRVRDVVQSVRRRRSLLLLLMHVVRPAHSPLPTDSSISLPYFAFSIPINPSFARLDPWASSKVRTDCQTWAHHIRM